MIERFEAGKYYICYEDIPSSSRIREDDRGRYTYLNKNLECFHELFISEYLKNAIELSEYYYVNECSDLIDLVKSLDKVASKKTHYDKLPNYEKPISIEEHLDTVTNWEEPIIDYILKKLYKYRLITDIIEEKEYSKNVEFWLGIYTLLKKIICSPNFKSDTENSKHSSAYSRNKAFLIELLLLENIIEEDVRPGNNKSLIEPIVIELKWELREYNLRMGKISI